MPPVSERFSLEFADVMVEIVSSNSAALEWLAEFLDPWWQPSPRVADWRVRVDVSASRYRAAVRERPAQAQVRNCFLFDQEVLQLPGWDTEERTTVEDAERSLYFTVAEGEVDVVADPSTNRWRFPLVWILTEVASARLRRRCLDLHAAAIDGCGRAVVIAGPKLAGKTSLALHLLARGGNWIGNDRVLLDAVGVGAVPTVRGVPSAVKLRPDTADRFPELRALAGAGRPYLLSEAEVSAAEVAVATHIAHAPTEFDLAFTPAQVATRLGVDRVAEAPLGAFVFPQVTADVSSWDVQPLSTDEVVTALTACVFGGRRPDGIETLFEALSGGAHNPSAEQIEALSRAAPGFRILLGPDAYDGAELAERLLGPGLAR